MRPLAILFTNYSGETLVYKGDDFKDGRWYTTPTKTILKPGETTYMEMANEDGIHAFSGLQGSIKFESVWN